MCGIFGLLAPRHDETTLRTSVTSALNRILHRGPDDDGIWIDPACGIALGHRRLAIVDLSPAGHQPMASADGRYVIVFNGEIYNHLELRAELERTHHPLWRGHSDTETLLAGIVHWGFEATLRKIVGMFALAVWDRQEHVLLLARDRMGEKPLYYGRLDGGVAFGSELSAFIGWPGYRPQIDRKALTHYLQLGWVAGEQSILEGIRRLKLGHWLRIDPSDGATSTAPYWAMDAVVSQGLANPLCADEEEAAEEFERLLRQSVSQQMLSDVPLGAFLSGGIDSSLIVSMMQVQSTRPVRTFCVGFTDRAFDEAPYAKAVANHLGTAHEEVYLAPSEALSLVPAIGHLFSEPLADISQLPTRLVCAMARRQVTVALSGDGGDELFAGYNRHRFGPSLWSQTSAWPRFVRRAAGNALSAVAPSTWDRLAGWASAGRTRSSSPRQLGDKLHKVALALKADDPDDFYAALLSPGTDLLGANGSLESIFGRLPSPQELDLAQRWLLLDTVTYMPDSVLVKVDRSAMSVSLETRAPFLDHRVVEFAWRLPFNMKLRAGQSKWLARKVLRKHVPDTLIDRPKSGFSVPMGSWLRGPLRAWAEELLDPRCLFDDGVLSASTVQRLWREHLSGRRNHEGALWAVLVYQSWRRAWGI